MPLLFILNTLSRMNHHYQEKEVQERIKELQEYNSVLRKRINELAEKINRMKSNREKN